MATMDSEWIDLNVGGQPFSTTRTTLMSCPDSFLAKMFNPNSGFKPARLKDGVYYLDTDPQYFSIILDWLRYRKIMADSESTLKNVAIIADYFGLDELVERINIKPVGKWVDYGDLANHFDVPAMKMDFLQDVLFSGYAKKITSRNVFPTRIAQFPDGLGIVKEEQVEPWGGKCLVLDRERPTLWVPTVVGKVPAGAISVEGLGGQMMHIGRKDFYRDTFIGFGENIVVPYRSSFTQPVSVGYVNEDGIFGVTFKKKTDQIRVATIRSECGLSFDHEESSTSEFAILCAF